MVSYGEAPEKIRPIGKKGKQKQKQINKNNPRGCEGRRVQTERTRNGMALMLEQHEGGHCEGVTCSERRA